MPTLPPNPQTIGSSGHVNDHNTIVTALSGAVYASGQTGTVDLSTATVKGAGLDLLNTTTFSGSAGFNVDNVFTATYENYRILLSISSSTAEGSAITMQLRAAGTTNTTANYHFNGNVAYGTTLANYSGTAQTSWVAAAGTGSAKSGYAEIEVSQPKVATETSGASRFVHWDSTASRISAFQLMLFHNADTAFDGFRLVPSTSMTGTVRVYGYRNS